MMKRPHFASSHTRLAALFAAAMLVFSSLPNVGYATGEIGEDVKELQKHLPEYEKSVHTFLTNVDGFVDTYEAKGAEVVDTTDMVQFWEDAFIHAAIEVNYVPIYAKIWQGIYGIIQGVENEKPVAEIRETQAALEQTLWQAMGAVKMAAKVQQTQKATQGAAEESEKRLEPAETVEVIKDKLDRIVAKCAERDLEAATEMVHDTYLNLFEGIEGGLIEHDPKLVTDLEIDFNVTLPQQIEGEAALEKITETTAAMKTRLDRASKILAKAEKNKKDVF